MEIEINYKCSNCGDYTPYSEWYGGLCNDCRGWEKEDEEDD